MNKNLVDFAIVRTLVYLFLIVLLAACANITPPEGGLRDEIPPQVVEDESTPNFQTRFQKQDILLTFDEWIELKDVFSQVVVSPPLEHKYELTIKRKTVRFQFHEDEELRPDATYTINFGTAIQDFTEKNPAENLRFVFSTGEFLDSLTVNGVITDALNGEPVEGVTFMLYDNLADSVVRTERPFYFGRTGSMGRFLIENVKAGTFKGFALQDANLNYLFDQSQEAIGFPDELITVSDTTPDLLAIQLFTEEAALRLMGTDDSEYGHVRLQFAPPNPDSLSITFPPSTERQTVVERLPDTTHVWYHQPDEAGWRIFLAKDTTFLDTVEVRVRGRAEFLEKRRFRPERPIKGVAKLHPTKLNRITFNHPIQTIDTAQIRFYEDTLRQIITPTLRLDTSGRRSLTFIYPWKEALPYTLELMPGALTDIYGLQNDTLIQEYQVAPRKSFGNLLITLDSLSADSAYVMEVYEGAATTDPIQRFAISNTTQFQQQLKTIRPAKYRLRIIADWNANGRWDTGNYDEQRQPEPIYWHDLEQLRANWDLEAQVSLPNIR